MVNLCKRINVSSYNRGIAIKRELVVHEQKKSSDKKIRVKT
jgi:hypothetical protein